MLYEWEQTQIGNDHIVISYRNFGHASEIIYKWIKMNE